MSLVTNADPAAEPAAPTTVVGARLWVPAVLGGIVLGVAAILTDVGAPTRTVAMLGELAGPWLLVAAYVGSRGDRLRDAAVQGLVALLVGVVVYDLPSLVAGVSPLFMVFWLAVAVVVGPIGGVAGWLRRNDPFPSIRVLAHSAVWGVAIGEAMARADSLNNHLAVVAGALFVVATIATPRGYRARATVATIVVAFVSALLMPVVLGGIAGW